MSYNLRLSFSFILVISIMFFGGFIYKSLHLEASQVLESAQEDKIRLEKELFLLEIEIAKKQKELDSQKGQSTTLSNEIIKLITQIKKSKLDIQAKNLLIQKLGGEIIEKSKQIVSLEDKIEKEKDSLAQLIRKERQIDNKPLWVLVLSEDSISNIYGDINNFNSIKEGIRNSVDRIRGVKNITETERQKLEDKKNKEVDTKVELENVKKKVELTEGEKQKLLLISKDKEKEYQKILEQRKIEASKIRTRLFELAGGFQGGGIEFKDAVAYAEYASLKTGVRTAFILGILKQETNIGKNVGLCMLVDPNIGTSRGINTGTIFQNGMKPSRDIEPFLKITEQLGIDPYKTRISCPIAGVFGWGGAMGPSQFIPSTWVLFANKIAQKFNVLIANPWNPQHAIMATALYLQDLGASNGGYTAERNAACRYYSGKPCSDLFVKNSFYGNAVMEHATKLEQEIIFIKEN